MLNTLFENKKYIYIYIFACVDIRVFTIIKTVFSAAATGRHGSDYEQTHRVWIINFFSPNTAFVCSSPPHPANRRARDIQKRHRIESVSGKKLPSHHRSYRLTETVFNPTRKHRQNRRNSISKRSGERWRRRAVYVLLAPRFPKTI